MSPFFRKRQSDPAPVPVAKAIPSRYAVEGILGHGGMGVVYAARDNVLERKVAIKTIRPDLSSDNRLVARFVREAKLIASLSSNPHVITIYDFGHTSDGSPFIVMEFLDGRPLRSWVSEQVSPSRSWVVEVGIQVAFALTDMHARGVLHRDLKPENIVVINAPTLPLVTKILDFGISRPSATDEGSGLTQAGTLLGTPRYMSPEVVAGSEAASYSDIYSFGIILYELATGTFPYRAHDAQSYLRAHIVESPAPFPDHDRPFPHGFEALVRKMLSKQPVERPTSEGCLRELYRVSADLDRQAKTD